MKKSSCILNKLDEKTSSRIVKHKCESHKRGFWDLPNNRLQIVSELKQKNVIQTKDDWYKVKNFGLLTAKYESRIGVLKHVFPEEIWFPWKFDKVPNNTWKSLYNRRQYINFIFDDFKFEQLYSISLKFTAYYSHKLHLLSELYPENYWVPWKFVNLPSNFFDSKKNRDAYIKKLEKDNGITKMEDWYNISNFKLLEKRWNFKIETLKNLFPQIIWNAWKFSFQKNCFSSNYNRRMYIESITNHKNMNDWYNSKLLQNKIVEHHYSGITLDCFSNLFPDIKWIPWYFKVPSNFWNSDVNIYSYLIWFEKLNNINSKEEWYYIKSSSILQAKGGFIFWKFGSLHSFLKYVYPYFKWDTQKLQKRGGKSQFSLLKCLKSIFGNEKILENYKHKNLSFEDSSKQIELDIFLPHLNLAFEYQGKQHYESEKTFLFGSLEAQTQRDKEKQYLCGKNCYFFEKFYHLVFFKTKELASITLIQVPFSWDGSIDSLKRILQQFRPDLK